MTARAWTDRDLDDLRAALGPALGAPAEREGVERDFGRLVRGAALAVLFPRSTAEVQRAVAFANARGLGLTPRGRGMSQGGQSVPVRGVVLDLSRFVELDAPCEASRTIRVSGGATWRDVVSATAPRGLLPKVAPLNLDLTVGGLLSVAGVGATSHTYGPAVACVAELEVVTGAGERITSTPTREPEVFQAALGGLGRAALIVGARLELRRYAPFVRTFYLLFDTVDGWLTAQRALIASRRADYLEAFCAPCVQGLRNGPRGRAPFARWFFALHVTVEHEPGQAPTADELLAGLGPLSLCHVEDGETVAFAARHDPRFAAMRASGAWAMPHPWVEAMLPGPRVAEILAGILEHYPVGLGDGPRFSFVRRDQCPPLLRMPASDEVACCALLPATVPDHALPDTLRAFRAIHDLMVGAGGKRVLSGWTTMMDEAALAEHYGEAARDWCSARRKLDPRGVLDSSLARHEIDPHSADRARPASSSQGARPRLETCR